MNQLISTAANFLRGKRYHFPDKWVEACLEWLFEEHADDRATMANNDWCKLIEQQWIYSDLRDFKIPNGFPLNDINVFWFREVLCFQIVNFINVGKSTFSQVQEVKGSTNDNELINDEDEGNKKKESGSNGWISLDITDGVSSYTAFEFEKWHNIAFKDIVIGSKVRLTGPFMVRNKIMLLKQSNIEFLGGEVETKLSNLVYLEDKLNSNISLKGGNSKNSIKQKHVQQTSLETAVCKVNPSFRNSKEAASNIKPTRTMVTLTESDFESAIQKIPRSNITNNTPIAALKPIIQKSEDLFKHKVEKSEFFDSDNLIQPTIDQQKSNNIKNVIDSGWIKTETTEFDDNIDDDEFVKNFDFLEEEFKQENCIKADSEFDDIVKFPSNVEKEHDIVIPKKVPNFIAEERRVQLNTNIAETTKPETSEPILTITDVFNDLSKGGLDLMLPRKRYKIKGCVKAFLTKLTIDNKCESLNYNNPKWSLDVQLSDETSSVDCSLDDRFMERKIGISASEFQKLKENKSADSVKSAIKDFQNFIVQCNSGIYTLELNESLERMNVIDFIHEPVGST